MLPARLAFTILFAIPVVPGLPGCNADTKFRSSEVQTRTATEKAEDSVASSAPEEEKVDETIDDPSDEDPAPPPPPAPEPTAPPAPIETPTEVPTPNLTSCTLAFAKKSLRQSEATTLRIQRDAPITQAFLNGNAVSIEDIDIAIPAISADLSYEARLVDAKNNEVRCQATLLFRPLTERIAGEQYFQIAQPNVFGDVEKSYRVENLRAGEHIDVARWTTLSSDFFVQSIAILPTITPMANDLYSQIIKIRFKYRHTSQATSYTGQIQRIEISGGEAPTVLQMQWNIRSCPNNSCPTDPTAYLVVNGTASNPNATPTGNP